MLNALRPSIGFNILCPQKEKSRSLGAALESFGFVFRLNPNSFLAAHGRELTRTAATEKLAGHECQRVGERTILGHTCHTCIVYRFDHGAQ